MTKSVNEESTEFFYRLTDHHAQMTKYIQPGTGGRIGASGRVRKTQTGLGKQGTCRAHLCEKVLLLMAYELL